MTTQVSNLHVILSADITCLTLWTKQAGKQTNKQTFLGIYQRKCAVRVWMNLRVYSQQSELVHVVYACLQIVLPSSDHTPPVQCGHYLNVAITSVSPTDHTSLRQTAPGDRTSLTTTSLGDRTSLTQTSPGDHTSLSLTWDDDCNKVGGGVIGNTTSQSNKRRDNSSGGVGGHGNNVGSGCSNVADDVEGALAITVYLKQGFVVDGLYGILSSYWEEVLLRDVECLNTQG